MLSAKQNISIYAPTFFKQETFGGYTDMKNLANEVNDSDGIKYSLNFKRIGTNVKSYSGDFRWNQIVEAAKLSVIAECSFSSDDIEKIYFQ